MYYADLKVYKDVRVIKLERQASESGGGVARRVLRTNILFMPAAPVGETTSIFYHYNSILTVGAYCYEGVEWYRGIAFRGGENGLKKKKKR